MNEKQLVKASEELCRIMGAVSGRKVEDVLALAKSVREDNRGRSM